MCHDPDPEWALNKNLAGKSTCLSIKNLKLLMWLSVLESKSKFSGYKLKRLRWRKCCAQRMVREFLSLSLPHSLPPSLILSSLLPLQRATMCTENGYQSWKNPWSQLLHVHTAAVQVYKSHHVSSTMPFALNLIYVDIASSPGPSQTQTQTFSPRREGPGDEANMENTQDTCRLLISI